MNQAALRAASLGSSLINMEHFEWAKDKIMMGKMTSSCPFSDVAPRNFQEEVPFCLKKSLKVMGFFNKFL